MGTFSTLVLLLLQHIQREKLFTFWSSFSPLTFQLFCLFSFLNIQLSSSSAFIMQQVTSHIPLVNQFFSDLAGFSGFFSRSPKRTSVLDRVVAHRLPRASTVRWNFHLCAVNTVFEHECDIIQCFETIRGVWAYHSAGSLRVCAATGRWYFQLLPETISLHYASCGHFLQLEKQTIDSVFVRGIMQQFTQFFWLQRTLFNTTGSKPPNYKGTASSSEGVACRSPNGSMPRRPWTARARSSVLAASFGPKQGTCKDPIVFQMILFIFFSSTKMIAFFTA